MKHIILTAIILLISPRVEAQSQKGCNGQPREHLQFRIELITKHIGLSGDKQEKFRTLYTKYVNEIFCVASSPTKIDSEASDEAIEAQILNSFDRTDLSTKIKREYYTKFKEILSPPQILEMYNIERVCRRRVSAEHQRRAGRDSLCPRSSLR